MDKQHILDEIRLIADLNGGISLGRARFEAETGIKSSDWYGKYWRSWGEAVTEAGYRANQLQKAFDEDFIIGKLAELIRELGRFPVSADLRMKARSTQDFPSHSVFGRLGGKAERAQKTMLYCQMREGFEDVMAICQPIAATHTNAPDNSEKSVAGMVYLMRCGRFYKIGRTNSVGRRSYELAIQLPEKARLIHQIKTDDPSGIEEYWHHRFREKRRNGEWFMLSPTDVTAFRRRRFM